MNGILTKNEQGVWGVENNGSFLQLDEVSLDFIIASQQAGHPDTSIINKEVNYMPFMGKAAVLLDSIGINFFDTEFTDMSYLYFSAPWCVPCKSFKPVVEEVAGSLGIKFDYIDVDQQPEYADKMGIRSVPTIIVIKDGEEVFRNIGVMPVSRLTEKLKSLN